MGKLNKFTAFMGNKFQPVFGKIVYRNMRRKPIVPKELKRLSDLAPLDKDKVQLVAHRGLSGAYPENTAPSFEAAGKHGGYFGLECDTHMTRDGVWVIMHDPDVSTIYSGSGFHLTKLKECTSQEAPMPINSPDSKLARFRNTSTSAKSIIATR